MIDYYICITTYNRPNYLNSLLADLSKYDINKRIMVFDDFSPQFDVIHDIVGNYKWAEYYRAPKHYGKEGYWKMFNEIFNVCKSIKAKKYIFLPDDVMLKDNFFEKAINIYNNIEDSNKICLSLLMDETRRGKTCWTNYKPIDKGDIYKTQWNDLCFMCEYGFFEMLNFSINPISSSRFIDRNISSGVGRQISIRLNNLGCNMYHVKESLVIHDNHESQMNPNERNINKLISG